jgi:LemA protein
LTGFWIFIGIVVLAALWFVGTYNGLVRLKVRTEEAWSDIDVQLRRRYDLIANLVETVKGYAAHESGVFEKVAEARSAAVAAGNVRQQGEAENMLTGALRSLFAVAENYPQLRASENFMQLQRDLTDTEDKIQASRRFYNANVRDLNTRIQSFPANVVANMFSFERRDMFEIEEPAAREPVKVSFTQPPAGT